MIQLLKQACTQNNHQNTTKTEIGVARKPLWGSPIPAYASNLSTLNESLSQKEACGWCCLIKITHASICTYSVSSLAVPE